ncbi:hypothetical protein Hanom_Chr16g01419151 [Helianthus anomalus]
MYIYTFILTNYTLISNSIPRRNSVYSCAIVCPYRVNSVFRPPKLAHSSTLG